MRFSWAVGRSRRFSCSPHRRDLGLAPSSCRLPLKGGVIGGEWRVRTAFLSFDCVTAWRRQVSFYAGIICGYGVVIRLPGCRQVADGAMRCRHGARSADVLPYSPGAAPVCGGALGDADVAAPVGGLPARWLWRGRRRRGRREQRQAGNHRSAASGPRRHDTDDDTNTVGAGDNARARAANAAGASAVPAPVAAPVAATFTAPATTN